MRTAGIQSKLKIGVVYSTLPEPFELDFLDALNLKHEAVLIVPKSVGRILSKLKECHRFSMICVPDFEVNPSYLPGLEMALNDFSMVFLKERVGLYVYQVLKAKRKNKFRLILLMDNLNPFPCDDVSNLKLIRDEVVLGADQIWVQTKAMANSLKVEGVQEDKIYLTKPYLKHLEPWSKEASLVAKKKLNIKDQDYVISYVGSVEWEDNLLDLLWAMKLIVDDGSSSLGHRIKLIINGVGGFLKEIKNQTIRLGLDRVVIFLSPWVASYEETIRASNVMYFAPIASRDYREGSPVTILGAMKMGVNIISSRNPLIEELLGKHRFDFCIGSPVSLVTAIEDSWRKNRLRQDMLHKNYSEFKKRFSSELSLLTIHKGISECMEKPSLDYKAPVMHQILEAESLVSSGQFLSAIDLLEKLFDHPGLGVPEKSQTYQIMGDAFAKLEDFDAARRSYELALELRSDSARSYLGLGVISLAQSQYNEALLLFRRTLEFDPRNSMAALGYGLSCQGLTEFDNAQLWMEKSLELNPSNTVALNALVKLTQDTKRFHVAEKLLQKYLHRHPSDQNIRFAWGSLLYQMGKFSEAVSCMEDILVDDPSHAMAQHLFKQSTMALNINNAN